MELFTSEDCKWIEQRIRINCSCNCSGFALSHTVEGLMPQTQYRFRLRAGNSMGYSQWSPTITVATTGIIIAKTTCEIV